MRKRKEVGYWKFFRLFVLIAVLILAVAFLYFSYDSRNTITGNVVFGGTQINSVKSGLWSDASVWSLNRVPKSTDSVVITHAVEVNGYAEAQDIQVNPGGVLKASRSSSSFLNMSGSLVVHEGKLDYGTSVDPIPANINAVIGFNVLDDKIFTTGPLYQADHPDYKPADTGLWVIHSGSYASFHGAKKNFVWTKLGVDAKKGDSEITLASAPTGWRVGDSILISSTSKNSKETEIRKITSISSNKLGLDKPLDYFHEGSLYAFNPANNVTRQISAVNELVAGEKLIKLQGEVGLLTHNVRVQSNLVKEGDYNHRSHTAWMMGASGNISYAEFRDLGPRGRMGRYSIHLHKIGEAGRGFTIEGVSAWSSVNDAINKWVVIHSTNGVNIKNNVGYFAQGRGYYLEDADEIDNVFRGNLGVRSVWPEELINKVVPNSFDQDNSAATFWLREGNTIEDNVASGGQGTGGFWITPNTNSIVRPTSFKNNEAHGNNVGVYFSGRGKGVSALTESFLWRNKAALFAVSTVVAQSSDNLLVGNAVTTFSGKLGSQTRDIQIFEKEPRITIQPIENPSWTNTKSYNLVYTLSDGLIDSKKTKTFNLNDGYNVISFDDSLKSGDKVKGEYYVRIDSQKPVIEIPSNVNPSTTTQSPYLLKYIIKDGSYVVNKEKEFNLVSGLNTLSITDKDFYGNTQTATYSVTYTPQANLAPVISGIANSYEVFEKDMFVLQMNAEDPENNPLTYSLDVTLNGVAVNKANLKNFFYSPGHIKFSNVQSYKSFGQTNNVPNKIIWQPDTSAAGVYTFKFKATDDKGVSSEKTFTVTVKDKSGEEPYFIIKEYNAAQFQTDVSYLPLIPESISPKPIGVTLNNSDWRQNRLRITMYDPQGDAVSLSVSGQPSIIYNTSFGLCSGSNSADCLKSTDIMFYQMTPADLGIKRVTFTVTDSKGNKRDETFLFDFYFEDLANPVDNGKNIYAEAKYSSAYPGKANLSLVMRPDWAKDFSFRFTLDEKDVSPILKGTDSFLLDVTPYTDGLHAVQIKPIDHPSYLSSFVYNSFLLRINNTAAPETGSQIIPRYAFSWWGINSESADISQRVGYVNYSGNIELKTPHPYPHPYSAPAWTLADPSSLINPNLWFVDPLVHHPTKLNDGDRIPIYNKGAGGHTIISGIDPRRGKNTEDALHETGLKPTFDGTRNNNLVTPYSTFVPNPVGLGWYGIDVDGRLFRIYPDGEVKTIAGYYKDSKDLPTLSTDKNLMKKIGNFEGNVMFNAPNDLYFDVHDSNILYVADTGNHRIAKVDISNETPIITTLVGNPGVQGFKDGVGKAALFKEPYSLVASWKDGSLYVADRLNDAIRKVYVQNGTVETVYSRSMVLPGTYIEFTGQYATVPVNKVNHNGYTPAGGAINIDNPQVIRMNSKEQLIIGDSCTLGVWELDLQTKTLSRLFRPISTGTNCNSGDEWLWLDVDWRGNIGPKDDIIVPFSRGGNHFDSKYNQQIARLSADGMRAAHMFPNCGGNWLVAGDVCSVIDIGGHYPWAVAIDDEEARFVISGFASYGVHSFRRMLPTDSEGDQGVGNTMQDLFYNSGGKSLFDQPEQMYGKNQFASPLVYYDLFGYSMLGNYPLADDLYYKDPQTIADYLRSGFGNNVQRPDMVSAKRLNAMYTLIDQISAPGLTSNTPISTLPTEDKYPEVKKASAQSLSQTSAKITWKTDELAVGIVQYGPNEGYGLLSSMTLWYGKDHEMILNDLPAGKVMHYRIIAMDKSSNVVYTEDYTFTTSALQSCSAQGGSVCSAQQRCSVSLTLAADTNLCCTGSCLSPVCGNGVKEGTEVCDGNPQICSVNSYLGSQSCKSDCTGFNSCVVTDRCGDSRINGPEQCDDGNANSGDGCSSSCIIEPGQLDSDNDGVPNSLDKCAGTSSSIPRSSINLYGCPIPRSTKFDIKPDFTSNDLLVFKNFRIGILGNGTIDFGNRELKLVSSVTDQVDLDNNIEIRIANISINSNVLSMLNVPANITFNGISYGNPKVLRDGIDCTGCKNISYDRDTRVLIIQVPGFSNYEIVEGVLNGTDAPNVNGTDGEPTHEDGSTDSSGSSGGGGGGGGSGGSSRRNTWTSSDSELMTPNYNPTSTSSGTLLDDLVEGKDEIITNNNLGEILENNSENKKGLMVIIILLVLLILITTIIILIILKRRRNREKYYAYTDPRKFQENYFRSSQF